MGFLLRPVNKTGTLLFTVLNSPFSLLKSCRRMLKQGFNGFRFRSTLTYLQSLESFIFYSTSVASNDGVTTPPMVEYLVNSIGFSEREAVAISTKVRHPSKCIKKSILVVDFLKESGLDGTQIRKVVASMPRVLRCNVDKTLVPKIRAFQDVGFFGSDLGIIISRHPHVLHRGLESHIVPVLEMLKSLFDENEQLVKIMLQIRSPNLLSRDALQNLPANIVLLRSCGVTSQGIKLLLLRRGFLFSSTHWVEKTFKRVEEKLGIPRKSSNFVYGVCLLTKKREEKIDSMLEVFRTYGWNETEISKLLKKYPLCLTMSKKSMELRLKFFMDLGYGSDYLVTHTAVLSRSLEKRIVPRVAVMKTLKDRHLLKREISMYYFLLMAESEFLKRFVIPYKENLPQLFEYYTGVTG